MEPNEIIEALGMQPHPEGGHFVETWRGPAGLDGRPTATAIYFLLRPGERSHWHRVDASEVWLHHDGAPLELSIHDATAHNDTTHDETTRTVVLGRDLASGQRPQAVVPAHAWQAARPLGGWTLVSCVVAPGFDFAGFELAPPDWTP